MSWSPMIAGRTIFCRTQRAYGEGMGQCCLTQALGCACHLLEAISGDSSEEATRRRGPIKADKGRDFPAELFSSHPKNKIASLGSTCPPFHQHNSEASGDRK
jgi:hypothetical protein